MVKKIFEDNSKINIYVLTAYKIYVDEKDQTQLIPYDKIFTRKKDALKHKNKIKKQNYCNIQIKREVREKWPA